MIFFLNIIINIFFILLPNILYIMYVSNKQNLNEDINKTVLDISLLSSAFLIILFNSYMYNIINIIFIVIVFLLSLKYKRNILSILLSIIFIEYIHNCLSINYLYITLLFLLPFVFNIIIKNKYINKIAILLIAIILYLFFNKYLINIITLLISYILIIYILNKSYKILELQNLLKEYKKDSELKSSLFKITHEIKNPLAVVKGYLSMINIENKEKAIKYLDIISSEVERSINLLNDFMQFSKIEINKEMFELDFLLDEVKNILISLTNSKKIKLRFKTEKDIIINADYNRIKQVLINVIKNSIEASKDYSNIDITCFINKHLNIIIRDYGSGIDNETFNKLFTPFNTTKEKGTGLGVCLSKEIIEAHNGKITYNSILGKGTTVKIVLPIN